MSSDTSDGHSIEQAWKTAAPLKRIKIRNGDSILFRRGGQWIGERFELHQSGRPGSPVYIGSYGPRNLPKPHLIDSSTQVLGIGADHVVVSGLKLSGAQRYGISTLGRNRWGLELRGNEIAHCTNGIMLHQAGQVVIKDNDIHSIYYNRSNKGAVGVILDNCENILVHRNTFRDCIGTYNGKSDGGSIELFRSNKNIKITENRAINTWGFIEMGGETGDTIRNVKISSNTAMNTRTFAWLNLDTPIDTTNIWGVGYDSIQIINNTLIQNISHNSSAIGASGLLTDSRQVVIENNIFTGDSLYDFIYRGNFHLRRNLFWSKNKRHKSQIPPNNINLDPTIRYDTSVLTYSIRTTYKDSGIGSPQESLRN